VEISVEKQSLLKTFILYKKYQTHGICATAFAKYFSSENIEEGMRPAGE
jgi:hypothetical protein